MHPETLTVAVVNNYTILTHTEQVNNICATSSHICCRFLKSQKPIKQTILDQSVQNVCFITAGNDDEPVRSPTKVTDRPVLLPTARDLSGKPLGDSSVVNDETEGFRATRGQTNKIHPL